MNTEQTTQYLYHHTKHGIIQVIRTTEVTISKTLPMEVIYAKQGAMITKPPQEGKSKRTYKTDTYFEDAPRITFAGRIEHMSEANPDMIKIYVGACMTKGKNHFNRKAGRNIAKGRADKCPLLIIFCLESEATGVFHKAIERLIPVILETEKTMCGDPHEVTMSLSEILEEETAD